MNRAWCIVAVVLAGMMSARLAPAFEPLFPFASPDACASNAVVSRNATVNARTFLVLIIESSLFLEALRRGYHLMPETNSQRRDLPPDVERRAANHRFESLAVASAMRKTWRRLALFVPPVLIVVFELAHPIVLPPIYPAVLHHLPWWLYLHVANLALFPLFGLAAYLLVSDRIMPVLASARASLESNAHWITVVVTGLLGAYLTARGALGFFSFSVPGSY